MATSSNLSPRELREAAVQAIVDSVGVAGLIRFLQDLSPGEGDYTADRWKWLKRDQPLEEIIAAIKETEKALGLDIPPES